MTEIQVGKDYSSSIYADISAVKKIDDQLSLRAGYRFLNDVSGANISTLSVGVRLSF